MKSEKKQIIKKILIHDSIRDRIDMPSTLEAPVICCDNITREIDSILVECEGYSLLTLIIVPFDLYNEIHRFLNLTDYSRIFYQMILIGDEKNLINDRIERLYHIADFLTEKPGEHKLNFVIKKSFSIIEKHYQNEQKKRWYYNRLVDSQRDQEDLINIGKALSAEKKQ